MARAPWPPRFSRIPADEWVSAAPETLALKYDTVQDHGWYSNLDQTVRAREAKRAKTAAD